MWIKEFENRYEITKEGKVFFHKNGTKRERKLVPDKDGYLTVNLKKDGKVFCKKIHREVGIAYIEPFTGEQINHKDGNKQNNNVSNLEWCNNADNLRHAREMGFKKIGSKYSNNTTGHYGIIKKKDSFVAQIKRGRKNIYLGTFKNIEEAANVIKESIRDEANGLNIKQYKTSKIIYQIDDNDNIVDTFSSIAEAEKKTSISNQSIGKVILGKAKTAGGYKWKRKETKENAY